MLQYTLKVAITAIAVVAINEVSKRSSTLGAIIASLPLTSLLAFVWLYGETGDTEKVAALARDIFWYVLPSLVLFVVLPAMLWRGYGFWPSLLVACATTFAAYLIMSRVLVRFGIAI